MLAAPRWAIVVAVLASSQRLVAQSRDLEVGLDGGLQYAFDSDIATFDVPIQRIRLAFPAGNRLALEPALSFAYADLDGSSSTALRVQLGGLYALSRASLEGAFLRPFVGLGITDIEIDGLVNEDVTTLEIGAGIGSRSGIGDRLMLRFEGNLRGSFPSDDLEDDIVLGATVGLSFFTK
jgi:hypothetical protein